MKSEIRVADDADALADEMAGDLAEAVDAAAASGRRFALALSGGSTPARLYARLGEQPWVGRVRWDAVEFFWGDERCVPPDHTESNYRMTRETLLDHLPIKTEQIHRIRGEDPAEPEARRYEGDIRASVTVGPTELPRFDWILLGMGDDGHTASLFPGQALTAQGELCGVARHPTSGQQRVSFTAELIDAAARVAFLVTGAGKAKLVADIIRRTPGTETLPAAQVAPEYGNVVWYLDRAAAAGLD